MSTPWTPEDLVASAPLPQAVIDLEDGSIVAVSECPWGLPMGESVALTEWASKLADDGEFDAWLSELRFGAIKESRQEFRFKTPTGHIWLGFAARRLAGDEHRWLAVLDDVTGMRQATEMAEAMMQQAVAQRAEVSKRKQEAERLNTELQEANSRLASWVERDSLTGMLSYQAFRGHLPQAVEQARMLPSSITLMVAAIDGFRAFNHSHGHRMGDAALTSLAKMISDTPAQILAGRLGPGRFGIALLDQSDGQAVRTADALRNYPDKLPPDIAPCTLSVGLSRDETGQVGPMELFRSAEGALHEAQSQGRGRIAQSDPFGFRRAA